MPHMSRSSQPMLWTGLIAGLLLAGPSTLHAEMPLGPGDWEMASVVVGKDGARDIERKLGSAPCLLPSASGGTTSYLYNVAGSTDPSFLRFEVNGRVDAITISKDPPIAGVCYAPAGQTVLGRTGKGIQLGALVDEVVSLYGKPTESFSVGPMTRFRYVAVYDRAFEWDLVFRGGRLVEWTVAAEQ